MSRSEGGARADHGVSEAVYFSDPDGNGIELYHDRALRGLAARRGAGQLQMVNARLDLEGAADAGLSSGAKLHVVSGNLEGI